MIKKIIDLGLEQKLLIISLIIILFLIIKIILSKRKISMLENKILFLEINKNKKNNTKLDRLTKQYLNLRRNTKEEYPDEEDFEKWLEKAEIGDEYNFKNK